MKLDFLERFSKYFQLSNFMNIRPVGPEFLLYMRTDRRTDMTNVIVAFRNFATAPENEVTFVHNVSDRDALMTNCIVPRER